MPDYIFSDSDQLPVKAVEQWDANIAAIRTLRAIEAGGRKATPEEQAVLARYSGFGNSAFAQAFAGRPSNRAWGERGRELRELISPEEYESIRGSRLNAFYTSSGVIKQMWSTLAGMGAGDLKSPVVLEPSVGSGRFLGLQPPEMARRSKRIAVELDSLTGSIAKHAYPDTQVHVAGYEDVHIPDNYVDIAISNVPFGNYPVYDEKYSGQDEKTRSIHNYFFAKTVDKLKPGGVAAFITSHYTMDSAQARDFREGLAEQADFLGAIRLPQNAFPDTQVVTDIIYLRKRDPKDRHPVNRAWVETETVELPTKYVKRYGRYGDDIGIEPQSYTINSYFKANPDQVLGVQDGTGSMRGANEYTVRGTREIFTPERFDAAREYIVDRAPNIKTKATNARPAVEVKLKREHAAEAAAVPAAGSYRVNDGTVERMQDGTWQLSDRTKDAQDRIKGMLSVRDDVRGLMDMELSGDADDDAIGAQRAVARQTYASFVERFGDLNAKKNITAFAGDPDVHFLRGLEVLENDEWRGSDIFQRRTFSPASEYNAGTPEEALAVSLNVKGRVDVDYMATILGTPRNEVVQALVSSGQIFLNPETRSFERRAQYLSGPVKAKLEAAKSAAETTPSYRANVQALEKVQPERIGAGDIYLSMGSSWIPQDVMNQGLAEILSGDNRYDREIWQGPQSPRDLVAFSSETGTWGPSSGMIGRRSNFNAAWGTDEVPAAKIIEHAVSNRPLRVNTKDDEGKTHFDEVATRAAKQKIDELRGRFQKWAWEDPERTVRLEEVYNESQNVSIPRQYDAAHLTFPGMSAKWQGQLLPHQREAVVRVVQDGNVMLAHEVGFGKTSSMVAASMERKRLGLSQKPMFVLPNATAAQFAAEFRQMYPTARILFEENVDSGNRKAFLDRVRNNDWDAVLLTYSQFERIPVTIGTLDKYQDMMMEQLDAGLSQARTEGNEYREKQIQNLKKRADTAFKKKREKLEALFDQGAVPFELLGVDQMFVDEADNFKNLAFFTSLDNIKGLNPGTQSMRGWDMFMKTQLIQGRAGQIRNAKGEAVRGGVVFATGSSISNSLAEMWTMMRYLHLDELEKRGLDTFDAWAGNYGKMEEAIEVRASGEYKPTTRFSKFANLPELSSLWQGVADIRVQSELPVMLERQPRLVDEEGNPKRVNVQAPKTPAVEAYMKHIATRAKELDSDTKRDNMLKLSGDARKASLDVRFAPPFSDSKYPWPPPPEEGVKIEANPQGKIPLMVDRVAGIYHAESEARGTQLVFLDMGTPSAKEKDGEATSKDSDEQDDLALDRDERVHLKETYDMIRRALEAKGIPRDEIAFIHDVQKNEQKQRLFGQVRDGQIRVLLGSTNKLGVGVNVQDRLAAIHHIDVPWRPRDVEQREGRIIRTGNKVYGPQFDPDSGEMLDKGLGVKVFKYIQQGSFDEFMWQAVEKKAAGIKAVTKRNVTARESDDLDEFVLSASEARALASGDPRAVELVTLETKLAGMKLDRAAYESQRANAQSQIGTLTHRIDVLSQQVPNYARDADLAGRVLEKDEYSAHDSEGKSIEKRPDAEKEFKALLARTPFGKDIPMGTYKGFKLYGANRDTGYQIILESPGTGQKYLSNSFDRPDSTNVLARADNVIKAMVSVHADKVEQLAKAQVGLRSYRTQLDKPYDQLNELAGLERRARDLRVNVQGADAPKAGTTGKSVEFSREKLVEEDIQEATDEDMIDAEQRVLAQVMEQRRKDRSYQTPTGAAFDGLVSEALQDILDGRRQKETGIDPHVAPDLMDDVPDSVPADLRDEVATAIEEPYDMDPGDATAIGETARKDDLDPGEVGDVVERVAERIQLESEDNEPERGPTVISLSDVDAMLQEEMKDEGIEEGIIPQYADTDYGGDGPDDDDAYVDVDGTLVPEAQESPATEAPGEFMEPTASPTKDVSIETPDGAVHETTVSAGPAPMPVPVAPEPDAEPKYAEKRRLVPVRLPQGGTSYVLADPAPVEADAPSPVAEPGMAMPAMEPPSSRKGVPSPTSKQLSAIKRKLEYNYNLPVPPALAEIFAGWTRHQTSDFISLLDEGSTGHSDINRYIAAQRPDAAVHVSRPPPTSAPDNLAPNMEATLQPLSSRVRVVTGSSSRRQQIEEMLRFGGGKYDRDTDSWAVSDDLRERASQRAAASRTPVKIQSVVETAVAAAAFVEPTTPAAVETEGHPDPAPVEADTPSPSASPLMSVVDEGLDLLDPDAPESGPEAWEPADDEERRLATLDALEAMPDDTRDYHDDVLHPRLSDVADEYDTALLAMRLGADPDPRDLDREEGTLRRRASLASGQSDMFGATESLPATMVLPPDTGPVQEQAPRPTPLVPDSQAVLEAVTEEDETPDPQREGSPGGNPLVPDSQAVVEAVMEEGREDAPAEVAEDALAHLEGRSEMDPEEVEDALGHLEGRSGPDPEEVEDDAPAEIMDGQESESEDEEDAPPKEKRRTRREKVEKETVATVDDDDVVVVTDAQAEEEPVDDVEGDEPESETASEAATGPAESGEATEPTAQRQRLRKRLETLQRDYLAAQRDGDKKKATSLNEKAEEIEIELNFLGSAFRRKDVEGDAVPRRTAAKATRTMIPDDAEVPVKELVGAAAGGGKEPRGRTPGHLKDNMLNESGRAVRGGSRSSVGNRVPGEIRAFARQVKRR